MKVGKNRNSKERNLARPQQINNSKLSNLGPGLVETPVSEQPAGQDIRQMPAFIPSNNTRIK